MQTTMQSSPLRRAAILLFLFLLLLLGLGAAPAMAQEGRVVGRVTDNLGNPVAGAQVLLYSATDSLARPRAAVTGETGGFEFTAVPAGEYRVVAAGTGYRPREVRVSLKRDELETVIARLPTGPDVPTLVGQQRTP
jgi:protocatechuate 3,4-dioxygenase beta subunit